MFKKIAIIGMNYLSISFVSWLRRITPRIRVDVFTRTAPFITSPRRLKHIKSSKDALYAPPNYIEYLLFPRIFLPENLAETAPEKLSKRYDAVFLFKEPSIVSENRRFNLSDPEGWARLLSWLKDGCVVFEPCPVCIQLAIYLRDIGVKSYVGGRLEGSSFPAEFEKTINLLLEETGLFDYRESCAELGLSGSLGIAEMYIEGQVGRKYIIENYLDENVEQATFSLALDVLGIKHKKPLDVMVIEGREDYLFHIYQGIANNVSTTKIGLGDKSFVRVVSDRDTNTIHTIYGLLKSSQIGVIESYISLFLSPDINENVPYIAMAGSPLLKNMPVLRSNLHLWRKNLSRKLVQTSLSTKKLGNLDPT